MHSVFEKTYFDQIYDEESCIDGDYNARDHAKYLKAQLDLQNIEIDSLIDLGFGKGALLYQTQKLLKPSKIDGIDISYFAYERLKAKSWAQSWNLQNTAIEDYKWGNRIWDLAICNSVLQYIKEKGLETSIEQMAKHVKYVYLHVPSQEDYKKLQQKVDFVDPFAFLRPNAYYHSVFSRHFVFVSWGILESKYFQSYQNSKFFDSLYRF